MKVKLNKKSIASKIWNKNVSQVFQIRNVLKLYMYIYIYIYKAQTSLLAYVILRLFWRFDVSTWIEEDGVEILVWSWCLDV